ncbi:MAG TPA: diguanylate cyclase [Elusimicrobiota bacterium]|nr:diguanylate cyclase [Elusimicrobiota bacterium]
MPDTLTEQRQPRYATPFVYLSQEFIQAKEYLEAIFASSSDAICTTDMKGRIIYFSPGAERMFGKSAREAQGTLIETLYAAGRDEARRIMRHLFKSGSMTDHELELVNVQGRRISISLSASLLRDRRGRVIGTLGIAKDISRRVELEKKLRELSITDNLTGLFNQRHFHERIHSEVRRARRQNQKLSLLVLDLDHFKKANDLWGHVEGDRILRETADILRASVRQGVDEAFRCGGDEFAVVLPGLGERVAEKVSARIAAAAASKPYAGLVGLSIGAAALKPADTVPSLIRRADKHMYRFKRARKT